MGDGLGDGLTFSAGDPTPLSVEVCAAGETHLQRFGPSGGPR